MKIPSSLKSLMEKRKEIDEKIAFILNAEQKQKYEELPKERTNIFEEDAQTAMMKKKKETEEKIADLLDNK